MKKILLVEDEPDLVQITLIWLEQWNYSVDVAESAEKALEILARSRPDIILLDLLLPKMQGDELCRVIKSSDTFKNIPVIVFTADTAGIEKKTHDIGAEDFETKPFDSDHLRNKIQRLLSARKSKSDRPAASPQQRK